jgi:hypothetical protein
VDYFFLVVPVSVVLFAWIGMVFLADLHPSVRHSGPPPDISAEAVLAGGAAAEGAGNTGGGTAGHQAQARQGEDQPRSSQQTPEPQADEPYAGDQRT